MQIILTKDVPKLGQRGDAVEVASGFARNKLIPQGLAEVATEEAIARTKQEKEQRVQEQEMQQELLVKNLEKLSNATITLKEKANEKGHLFSSIHTDKIIDALKAQAGIEIPESALAAQAAIKEVGEHKIEVGVRDKKATFTLVVEAV